MPGRTPSPGPDTGPDKPDHAALARAYRAETARVLCRRLDVTVALFLLLVGTSILMECLFHPDRVRVALLAYAVDTTLCLLTVVVVRHPGLSQRPAGVIAILGGMLAIMLGSYNAQVGGPLELFAAAEVCLLSGLFVLLPWGWRAQLAVTVVALCTLGFQPHTPGEFEAFAYAGLALLTGAITSVSGAFFLDRYRYDAFVRTALLTEASLVAHDEAETAIALARVAETLNSHLDQPDVLARVNRLAVEVLGCDWGVTFVWDEQRAAFRFQAHAEVRAEVAAELAEVEFTRDSLPIVGLLRTGTLVEIPDVEREVLIPPDLLRRWDFASGLVTPITRRDDVIGVLCFAYRTRTGPFSGKQRRLALGIAHATAVAFENARLIADLQAANRLKSNFVASMSHELRTPLNVVTGYTDLLVEGTFGALTPEQHDTVNRIHQSALELLELVSATLDLGRLEAGREVVHLAPVDVPHLFGELERDLAALVPPRVTLAWECAPDGAPVVTDRAKLRTILKNLAGNALKFTPAGTVTVTAAVGDTLRLTVRDTGIGIAPGDVPTIFEMFRQLDGSSTRRFGGVGLGLHIVQRLVDLLGGTIAVDSTPGQGSTFTVTLPARRPAVPADEMPSPPARASSGGTRAGS